ncbi:hypothetical protein PYW08_003345 [Mythimna loreyi]|uniref:Uncharacterized protein n=1 Tax=Mythimna loreyi TaxID=667449 RepID=A0ACC2QW30_9NEOP|nr:hypothetical protein PYW08_003345 [Mythimna loreyi]
MAEGKREESKPNLGINRDILTNVIFMTLVSTFTYVVITIWSSLYFYRTPADNSGELINTAVWCFSAIYTVGIMSISCELLLITRNETRILVNKVIMNYDLPKTMRVQAKAFMELVEAWPLRIYVYDLFSIFMTLVSTFTYVVITIWSSLYFYRKSADNSGELINTAVWCFSAIYTVGIMSISCELLLITRNETRILVNKVIMNYDLPKTMRVQAKAFMELVEAWPLRIYVYDLFSVDITLMLKFISVATTYLIVIIQISHFV